MDILVTLSSFVASVDGSTIAPLLAEVEEGHHGLGLNFDILETNVINLIIIIGVLIYFGRGFLGKTLSERRSQIEVALKDAEERKKQAASALAEEQQKLAQAKSEADRIRAAAEESAVNVRNSVLAQAEEDIARMRDSAAQDITTQQERVIRELRQRIAELAVSRAEDQLKAQLNEGAQQQLIDRSIATLGGRS
ncbi:F0F1 ATP synthase subunit B [Leptolyngbya sp. AN02str]|uniref:F0F1 ATP synthase subunit B n=1 Tax=Leptolyngbya sp. AN02str TaxID=3423363 RepID=UPI003D31FFD2